MTRGGGRAPTRTGTKRHDWMGGYTLVVPGLMGKIVTCFERFFFFCAACAEPRLAERCIVVGVKVFFFFSVCVCVRVS